VSTSEAKVKREASRWAQLRSDTLRARDRPRATSSEVPGTSTGLTEGDQSLELSIPGAISERMYRLPQPERLYVSPHNPGALTLATELAESDMCITDGGGAAIETTQDMSSWCSVSANTSSRSQRFSPPAASSTRRPCRISWDDISEAVGQRHSSRTPRKHKSKGLNEMIADIPEKSRDFRVIKSEHSCGALAQRMRQRTQGAAKTGATRMLLRLDKHTFVGDGDGAALAAEVRAALAQGLPIVTAHVLDLPGHADGVRFETLLTVTPTDLVHAGLYKALAIPWYYGPHRHATYALALRALGASPLNRRRRTPNSRGRVHGLVQVVINAKHKRPDGAQDKTEGSLAGRLAFRRKIGARLAAMLPPTPRKAVDTTSHFSWA